MLCLQEFQGNTDQNTAVENVLVPVIVARYLRIHPVTWHTYISMRAGFRGCFGKYTFINQHTRCLFNVEITSLQTLDVEKRLDRRFLSGGRNTLTLHNQPWFSMKTTLID